MSSETSRNRLQLEQIPAGNSEAFQRSLLIMQQDIINQGEAIRDIQTGGIGSVSIMRNISDDNIPSNTEVDSTQISHVFFDVNGALQVSQAAVIGSWIIPDGGSLNANSSRRMVRVS